MKHQDVELERYRSGQEPRDRVRITLTERRGGRWGTVVGVRRITLAESDLVQALKAAGLYERVEVTIQEETSVEADVAMFAALWTIPNPSQRAIDARGKLWQRILRRMGI